MVAEVLLLPLWMLGVFALLLIVAAVALVFFLKKILVNAVLGIVALFVINYFGSPYGIQIAITFVTVAISALFGLAGVGGLVLLKLLGVTIA
ncbi:SigmaK-factor processing regulatory protein BofA [Candidatus Norongarragalina meridionalis]|nr:SigmaK-factor processing regulatory protein BofA [Candidatus Norongarragalina meridionalis]